ncbi:hypothetical protein G7Z17_g8358 [Cylindrodendrum hubeiense]|uniref:C2H2-type domain-containing protein n=1 Tax=Cylindrodendrum hubeiense TaxID=595255 RepID=A0A9P5H5D1_9HYPO|nr:hypothetical protein G7Z17_g8358 [Cylindrodendrum hubeiense]
MLPWQARTSGAPAAQGVPPSLQGAEARGTPGEDLEQDKGITNDAELDFTQLELALASSYAGSQQTPGLFSIEPQDDWRSPNEGNSPLEHGSAFLGQEMMFFDPTLSADYPGPIVDNPSQPGLSDQLPGENYGDSWLRGFSSSFSPDIEGPAHQAQQAQQAEFQPSSYTPPLMNNTYPGLPRRRSRYLRSPGQTSRPISIPQSSTESSLDPMQRWQDSPPETEAASLSAIAGALRHALPRPNSSESLRSRGPGSRGSRAASTTSFNSENTSRSSRSAVSVLSSTSKDLLPRPLSSRGVAKKKRGKKTAQPRRAFQCTFCCDSFKSKYDWSRHEKSLHLSVDGLAHQLETIPAIDSWKVQAPPLVSRCGICNTMLDTWQGRVDHLAQHFREGKSMDDWRGDHCFEPSIAALVTNALPPYLIGQESRSIVPFSATDSGTKDHLLQIRKSQHDDWIAGQAEAEMDEEPSASLPALMDNDPTSTFVNVLTLGLGRYARQQMKLGIIPTDEMFQSESRRLLYRTEDAFDQTIADNSEWLSSFRTQHMGGSTNDKGQ